MQRNHVTSYGGSILNIPSSITQVTNGIEDTPVIMNEQTVRFTFVFLSLRLEFNENGRQRASPLFTNK